MMCVGACMASMYWLVSPIRLPVFFPSTSYNSVGVLIRPPLYHNSKGVDGVWTWRWRRRSANGPSGAVAANARRKWYEQRWPFVIAYEMVAFNTLCTCLHTCLYILTMRTSY